MEELIKAMSNDDLEAMKVKYAENESIVKLIDGILEVRVREVAQARATKDFERAIERTFNKLPHPDDIHNVYARWAEVDEPTGEPEEEVMIEGKPEMRQPSTKVSKWVVQVNKAVSINRGGSGNGTVSKRAITIYKREGLALENKGNYPSASKACEALGLTIGGDSATRVLARESYIVEPFTGELVS